jgi:uncharacterized protein
MIGRDPIGSVVETDGSIVTLNLADPIRGYVVGHRDGISAFEQPGDMIAIEAGSITIVARVMKIAFAEPRDLVKKDGHSTTPALRQMRVQVVGALQKKDGALTFEPRNSRLPVLGARAFPLSVEESAALVLPGVADDSETLVLGDDIRGIGLHISAAIDTLLGRHMAVLGSTGQGKTHFVAYITQQLAKYPLSRIVIFDVNGEYANAFRNEKSKKLKSGVRLTVLGPKPSTKQSKFEGATFRTIPYFALGRDGLMRLLIPSERAQAPSLRFAIEHLPFVETQGEGAKPAGTSGEAVIFDDCRAQGAQSASSALETIRKKSAYASAWPSMRALSCLAADNYDLQMGRNGVERNAFNYGHVSALVSRIRAFMDDDRFKTVVDPNGGAPIKKPLEMEAESANLANEIFGTAKFNEGDWNVHIIDLSRLAPDLMPFVLGSLLEMLASQLFIRGPGQTHPTLLVLEEAHHYLRQLPGNDDSAGQMRAYERLAKEGRKFGLSLLVSTQRPSELSPTVLAQCGTWAVFRLSNEADQKAVSAATESASNHIVSQVAGLGRGETIVFGAAIRMPSRINVRRPNPYPDSSDPPFSQEWIPPFG